MHSAGASARAGAGARWWARARGRPGAGARWRARAPGRPGARARVGARRRARARGRPRLAIAAEPGRRLAARAVSEAAGELDGEPLRQRLGVDWRQMSMLQARSAPSALRAPDLRLDYDKRLMLASGRANPELAARIADKLGVALSDVNTRTFSNGEVYCRFEDSVRGADVFIVQPTCANHAAGIGANDALMELLLMIDAAVGGSAHRVIAVTPWYGYSRQDKKSAPREPISARLVAHLLEKAGIDRILTMDLHSGQIQGFFQKPCDHMTAMFMLTQYFADLGLEDLVVVAPDAGRVKLAKRFASELGADLAILNKERPAQQLAEIHYVIGEVAGKTAVIVDDIIDTAGTLRVAAEAVHEAGARRLYAAATHGLFSGDAWQNLAAARLEQIVVTDTVPPPPGSPDNVRILSCADLLTNSIRQIFTDGSVSSVFGGENQLF